jgi:hypothetical protein
MVVLGHSMEILLDGLTDPLTDPLTAPMPDPWSMKGLAQAPPGVLDSAMAAGATAAEPDPDLRRRWRLEDHDGPPGHAASVSPISSNAPPSTTTAHLCRAPARSALLLGAA